MKTFPDFFKIILTGDKDASRQAAREVTKSLYASHYEGKYEIIASIVARAPEAYRKIAEDWRQENFVRAISVIYFVGNKKDEPDFLFSWLLELLQHKNGNIRHAAVRMFDIEFGPLTYYVRLPGNEPNALDFSDEQADHILLELYANLNILMGEFWKPEYKRYKYISSLPTGIYKSMQLLLSRLEGLCGKEYMDYLQRGY